MYKAETTIPTAFEIAFTNPSNLGSATRRLVRDRLVSQHILERMVRDLHYLLLEEKEEALESENVVKLWNGSADLVENGINYEGASEGEKSP